MPEARGITVSTFFDPAWQAASVALDVLAAAQAAPAALAARRRTRLHALVDSARRGSALYRQRLAGLDVPALEQIEPVGKDELMARFADWVTDPVLGLDALQAFMADPARIGMPFRDRWWVWESSGSSGRPGVFVQDAAAMAVYDALELLRRTPLDPLRRWFDPWYQAERSAFVGAVDGHFASIVSLQRLRRLQPWLAPRVQAFSFLQPLAALRAQLEAFAPTLLATYPSAALLLAEERAAGRLAIAPREIWTGGEALSTPMRVQIEQAFGCPLANSYGASEFLALAAPCRHGVLHLNSDWVILEPVDAQDRPVPPGQSGAATLLTNLANHVQPLIRYRLGDRVRLLPSCDCGSALPALEVAGRVDDSLVLHDAGGHPVRLLPLALTTVLEEQGGVLDFQLVQRGARALALWVAEPGAAAALPRACAALRAYLRTQGLAGVRVQAQHGPPPPPGRSGKRARVLALPAA